MGTRTSSLLRAWPVLGAAALIGPSAAGSGACGSDLDASGQVNSVDLALMLGQWTEGGGVGPCLSGPPADLNDDCRVNGLDLALLLAEWGQTPVFDFGPPMPNEEAAQIALEMLGPGGPLLPSAEDYQRVERDLALIRAFEPALVGAAHGPLWSPTQLHVYRDAEADQTEFQCMVRHYLAVEEVHPAPPCLELRHTLAFPHKLNVEALADTFATDENNFVVICRFGLGTSGSTFCSVCPYSWSAGFGGLNGWHPVAGADGVWQWTVRKGNHCMGPQEVWMFDTDAEGTVLLKDYQGPEAFAGLACVD